MSNIKQFLQILPGFYIASLAAIATFSIDSLDKELDTPLYLETKEHGKVAERTLTRRHFLCYLFGYLSFLSIILCVINNILSNANPIDILLIWVQKTNLIITILNYSLIFIFMIFFFQLICVTLLGLFYLCDRLHWQDKLIIPSGNWVNDEQVQSKKNINKQNNNSKNL